MLVQPLQFTLTTYCLFFTKLIRFQQVDGFNVTKIDFIAQSVDVQKLANVFLLLVPIKISLLSKVLPNVAKLFIYSLLLSFLPTT